MSGRRGLRSYPFSLAAILVFTGLLVLALWRLWGTEHALRTQAGDNMLWAIAQAQLATQNLDITVAQARLGEADAETLELRYDVVLSRLALIAEGPQRRYLEDLGHFERIQDLSEKVYAWEDTILSAGALTASEAQPLHILLADMARAFGRAANSAMVAQWNETGAHLDRQHRAIVQVIVMVIVILAIGAYISWRMMSALYAKQQAQMSLLREREIREAYRSFVTLVSHQFRTPLSVIDASMQRILRKGDTMPHSEIADRARRVRTTVANLTELMDVTLDSMKLDAGQIEINPSQCDLAAELDTVREQQLEAAPGRTVRIDIGAEVPARIHTDPLLLRQIVGNLVANALTYSPQTETVTIRVRADNNQVRIAVQDRGIGIPEAEKAKLFTPFFRASTAAKAEGGIGMGLHLSRHLARMLGGDLTFESRRGLGSTFTIELPF